MRLSEKMAEYFKQNLNRLDDKALAQLLQMHVKQHKGLPEDFMSPKVIRENVLRVLSQENFHTNNFVTIFKSTFELLTMPKFNPGVERRDLPVRQDLNFWVQVSMYIPRVEFQNQDQVLELQSYLIDLDSELVELDFRNLIQYLQEQRKSFQ